MSNSRKISSAIFKATGVKGIKVSKAQGCCRFYCEEECPISLHNTEAIYVNALNQLSLDQWVEAFIFEVKQIGEENKLNLEGLK